MSVAIGDLLARLTATWRCGGECGERAVRENPAALPRQQFRGWSPTSSAARMPSQSRMAPPRHTQNRRSSLRPTHHRIGRAARDQQRPQRHRSKPATPPRAQSDVSAATATRRASAGCHIASATRQRPSAAPSTRPRARRPAGIRNNGPKVSRGRQLAGPIISSATPPPPMV